MPSLFLGGNAQYLQGVVAMYEHSVYPADVVFCLEIKTESTQADACGCNQCFIINILKINTCCSATVIRKQK